MTSINSAERNRVELAVVELLADRIGDRLGDRDGSRHRPPWRPDYNVRIGVLRPRITDAPTEEEAAAAEEADGGDSEAPPIESTGVIGLDAIVELTAPHLTLEVDVAVSLYMPEFASHREALDRHRTSEEDDDEADAETGAALLDDGAEVTAEDGGERAAETAPEEPLTSTRRRAGVPVWDAWRRQRVELRGISVTVPTDGTEVEFGSELRRAIAAAIDAHFARPEASRPFTTATRTIPLEALNSEDAYWAAVHGQSNTAWSPFHADVRLSAYAESLNDDAQVQLSVNLTNDTIIEVPPMPTQDLAVYDCEIRVRVVEGGNHVPERFVLAPRDYRWHGADTVPGHGRGCVATQDPDGALRTEVLPRFLQRRVDPRGDHIAAPRFADLAADPHGLLLQISEAMRRFALDWEAWLTTDADPSVVEVSRRDLAAFHDEHARFDRGRDALTLDGDLATAFKLANRVFGHLAGTSYDTWRLFQLVYIVLHLPALAAREHRDRADYVAELDFVDVLWFPTGGGKTEAYLGLVVTALFYDRLRGKTRGVTSWMKFPLRMLSVQQLARVLRALVVAEDLRKTELGGVGHAFELGYLVGGSNTPNRLVPRTDGWWPGLEKAEAQLKEDPHAFDEHVIIGNCPYCEGLTGVGLELRSVERRLVHVCRDCERTLPVHMTDEEVYRFLPSVVVSTVDKITTFSWNSEATALTRGPRYECADHGWFSFGKCPVETCTRTRRQWVRVTGWKDPVPAFIVQDEMHLLREDLGTFSSHYEGLLRSLQMHGPSQLPSKILAASATIEGFEAQLSQVYCRKPRRFPSPGWKLEETFYVRVTDEARRLFLGVQPGGAAGRKVEVSGVIASELLTAAAELADAPEETARALTERSGVAITAEDAATIVFDYEVNLAFVNSKAHGSNIGDDLARLNDRLAERGDEALLYRTLTGEVTVPMLAEAIDLIEAADPGTPRKDRLRGLIGTSVVSHGVDLARLNTMVMCGLPTTTADYIQATARSGRTHVGLVVTVYDNWMAREVSSFTHFVSTHRFLERLVEAVPVNRWAVNGVQRTLPGLAVAHILDMAREDKFGSDEDLRRTGNFQKWWKSNAATGVATEVERRILDSYRSPVPGVNPTALEDELRSAAEARWRREQQHMTRFDKDRIQELFIGQSVMTSLRDVDDPVSFSAMPHSARAYEALYGFIPDNENNEDDG